MTPEDRSLANSLLRSIDHVDPTRSREAKPSERMANDRAFRRFRNTMIRCALGLVAVASLAIFLSR